MDERLERALEFSNFMITLENEKRILKEKYKENLIFYYNKGQFTITKEFISFIHTLTLLNQTEIVITDDNNDPIEIDNLKKFMLTIINLYFENTNAYLKEYKKLINERTLKGIIDL